jgi:predicted naringenin-chalcone synthase
MGIHMTAIGTATPSNHVTQKDAYENAKAYLHSDKRERYLKVLYSRSAIDSRATILRTPSQIAQNASSVLSASKGRNSALELAYLPLPHSSDDCGPSTAKRMQLYEREISKLATAACSDLLSKFSVHTQQLKESIESIVTVSCTGFSAPGFDIGLIKELALSQSVQRHHIGFMGCHGAINGLRVASALASTRPDRRVLLCAAEICSIHFQYGDNTDDFLANCLFADGAAAALISGHEDSQTSWTVRSFGSYLIPETEELMSWKIRDNGFVMTISPHVAEVIREQLYDWLTLWLSQQNLSISSIQGWAVHPGGPRIVSSVEQALDLDKGKLEASRKILRLHGNMSSPTVLFILEQIMRTQGRVPTVVLSFGPGLTIEAMLLS